MLRWIIRLPSPPVVATAWICAISMWEYSCRPHMLSESIWERRIPASRYLNEHGEPVSLANQEGELATPSAVLFDDGDVVVGTEAIRNAIANPHRVVQNSKRWIGKADHHWRIDGIDYTPTDIATFILKKLLDSAQDQIGQIDQAVITVPAQFSDAQRHATVEAGHRAGLQRVDLINEPVAAALCYVLGTEGLWFTELADEQQILVYDLGGGRSTCHW